jgi:endoglucanase
LKGAENTYGVFRLKGHPVSHLVTMSSKILPVAMAHEITKEPRYRDALAMAVQYTMGLNPMNRSYISGLGERSFVPYHHDWHTDNLPIPAGLPNFGPMLQYEDSWGWSSQAVLESLARGGLYPATLLDWPMSEKCFNQMWYPPVNEFMVQSPMGELLMLTGYLASHQ